MDAIYIENLRCFANTGWIPLAPLTVLVGENSSGKSTFLASLRLAWDLAYSRTELDFNEEPFQLGAFEQLAHVFGGRGGRAKQLSLGHRIKAKDGIFEYRTSLVGSGSQAEVTEQAVQTPKFSIIVKTEQDEKRVVFVLKGSEDQKTFRKSIPLERIPQLQGRMDWSSLGYFLEREFLLERDKLPPKFANESRLGMLREIRQGLELRPYAFAPVRTKPKRTYDPVKQSPDPEGEHIPMLLARMRLADESSWKQLQSGLQGIGVASGLFQNISVRRLGKSDSDPFQLEVKIAGPKATNLIDVGYGVSQILPLLVEVLESSNRQTFLMQQPEVHLHPRAQAELGSFLSTIAKTTSKRFVVETHSDYLVDRIRMDVRDGKGLSADDISILYFERDGGLVNIHQLTIDDDGNLLNTPESYREFFLKEEMRFLGA